MTETINYDSLEAFARDFDGLAIGTMDGLSVEMHKEIHRKVAEEVEDRTPVDEGDMRDNWEHLGPGQSSPTTSINAALSALDKPGETHIVNNAPHAIVIEKGRKKLETGRMGGSPKAPRGVVKPTLDAVPTKVNGIFSSTSIKVSRRAARRRRRR